MKEARKIRYEAPLNEAYRVFMRNSGVCIANFACGLAINLFLVV